MYLYNFSVWKCGSIYEPQNNYVNAEPILLYFRGNFILQSPFPILNSYQIIWISWRFIFHMFQINYTIYVIIFTGNR